MKIRKTHYLTGLVLLLAVVTLLLISYIRARAVADSITLPIQDEWYYYGTLFIPWHAEGGGPSWCVRYDARFALVTGPISVDVDLIGGARRTNPTDLRERIKKREEELSNHASEAIGASAPQPQR